MNKSEDVIYRQEALDVIAEMQMPIMRSKSETDQLIFKELGMARNAIEELDPAQPPERCIAEIKIDMRNLEELVIRKKLSERNVARCDNNHQSEQKKGKWKQYIEEWNGFAFSYLECSECSEKTFKPYSVCPNCKAKMEKDY